MPNGSQSNDPERDNLQKPRGESSDQHQHGSMGERGVTRPMDMMSHGDQCRSESEGRSGGSGHRHGTLVLDNLSTHTKGAFYEVFEPHVARAYVKRI